MNKLEKFKSSKEYILGLNQFNLLKDIREYLAKNKMSRSEFAEMLKVSKGYVSQIMSGEFDHKYSKIVELYWHIGKAAIITPIDMPDFVDEETKKDLEFISQQDAEQSTDSHLIQSEAKVIQFGSTYANFSKNSSSYTNTSKEIAI